MNIYVKLFTFVTCVAAATRTPTEEGMYRIKVIIRNSAEIRLVELFIQVPGFEIASVPDGSDNFFDVLVENYKAISFLTFLGAREIQYEITDKHFGKPNKDDERKKYDFSFFPRYKQINKYLESIASKNSKIVKVIKIGKSYEKRSVQGVKISTGGKPKPAIFIDAGIHAREWISVTTALYIIQELVQPSNKALLDKADFYIFPNINPDGYEYSHTANRFWRKNRSPNPGSDCIGTDLNRNFGYKWSSDETNNNPCLRTYSGNKAFSEIESKNVADFIQSLKGAVKVYLSLHSFGQLIMHPWGYTTELPPHEEQLMKAGVLASKQMELVRGTKYKVGNPSALLGVVATGMSGDWATGVAGAFFSHTIELPPINRRRKTILEFIVDPKEIIPVGKEVFKGLQVFAESAAKLPKGLKINKARRVKFEVGRYE